MIISWFVDFDALERQGDLRGSFNLGTLETATEEIWAGNRTAGGQGRHMTVLEDYQATLREMEIHTLGQIKVSEDEFVVLDSFEVKEGTVTIEVSISDDNPVDDNGKPLGDVDLYVNVDAEPTRTVNKCKSTATGSKESCTVTGPGTVYAGLHGYSSQNGSSDEEPIISSVEVKVIFPSEETKTLEAGITLNPDNPEDKVLLDAALEFSTEIEFLRTKNSWGGEDRPTLPVAPGPINDNGTIEKGYHDLYMDYLDGPIAKKENCKTQDDCRKNQVPLNKFVLPPGY